MELHFSEVCDSDLAKWVWNWLSCALWFCYSWSWFNRIFGKS